MTLSSSAFGTRALALLDELAAFTDVPGQLTRLYLSPSHKAAALHVKGLMEAAGMTAFIDAAGSVQGRYEGTVPDAPALIIGSHIDTVVDAGRYDGNLGVIVGILVVEALHQAGRRLPFAVEVVAFGDEENVRFATSFSTSSALTGRYDPAWLSVVGRDGAVVADALRAFGCDPGSIPALARPQGSVMGYLEVHIEQGPVLETAGRPLGIVTAIAGIERVLVALKGEAGHAGTVPMGLRRDALAAAAEMTVAAERLALAMDGVVATVGVMAPKPGAINVIPGSVEFAVDARAPDDERRDRLVSDIRSSFGDIAARRAVTLEWSSVMHSPATAMDDRLMAILETGVIAAGAEPLRLLSGAGHDAVAMAHLCPVAMLFVRCAGGISHNPTESITAEDAGLAVATMLAAVEALSDGR